MGKIGNLYYKHQTLFIGILSTILMLIVIGILFDWLIMPFYTKRGQELELPDVTLISFSEAEQILRSHGFRIMIDRVDHHPSYPESTIIAQNPPSFSKVKRGRRIYVTISAGERNVIVPHVVGKSERDAEFLIAQAGLLLGEVYYDYSNYHPKDVVSEQSIVENTEVLEKTMLNITVSIGQIPSRFIVPDLVGKPFEDARKILLKAGLRVGMIAYESNIQFLPATILTQSVKAGEEVEQGRRIDLVVNQFMDDSVSEE